MMRQNYAPFNPSVPTQRPAAPPVAKPQHPGRIPRDFKEAMLHIPVKTAGNVNTGAAAKSREDKKRAEKSAAAKWKSSFKPLGDEDDSPEPSTGKSDGFEIYDPYDPLSSDSEEEMPQAEDLNHCPPDQENIPGHQRLSQSDGGRKKSLWDVPPGQLLERRETKPSESRSLSPGHRLPERQAYRTDTELLDRPGYDSISAPLDHRACSSDRLIPSSSTQRFPDSYGGQRTDEEEEERIIIPEYRKEVSSMTTTVRLSPPRIQQDYQHQMEYMEKGLDEITPSTDVPVNRSSKVILDKNPITCDLCDVELSSSRELEDHLDCKSHWDTLEYIQQQNNYDDLAIAFLQEVMMYKSQRCSRVIEDSALQALQENDYMTKVEMFHCVACSVFVSTSASSVHAHITSQEHLSNTKEFQVQQRRPCLETADAIMKELKAEFEHFLKGGKPFE
ncbi:uncharacterized protein LOC131979829 [Centropristis striata]|uniref:uncharacterized protein LOC131979829 n=1 Tax=Centropristis striata TaxID=184440 RepID=UPI0027E0394B|nr:uncharacterized protein LOC131979829 [Centropristis striata]